MYVETSAIVAILLTEAESGELKKKLGSATSAVTSIVSQVESAISLGRELGDYAQAAGIVSEFMEQARIEVVDVSADMFDEVLQAYVKYGKGTGHSARLNFGDCFSYAIAKRLDRALLFKGKDFSHTDLNPA